MTVGVAIMSYNYGPLLTHALDSVFGQSVKPDEVFIVDDCSERWQELTKQIAHDFGVKLIQRKENMGIRPNFQDVLEHTFTADACMFLGADNWLHPQYIKKTLERLVGDVGAVGTDCFLVGEYGEYLQELHERIYDRVDDIPVLRYQPTNIHHANWIHGSALFDRKVALKVGGFYPENAVPTDQQMWCNMEDNGYTLAKVNEPLLYYRKHRNNFNRTEAELGRKKLLETEDVYWERKKELGGV